MDFCYNLQRDRDHEYKNLFEPKIVGYFSTTTTTWHGDAKYLQYLSRKVIEKIEEKKKTIDLNIKINKNRASRPYGGDKINHILNWIEKHFHQDKEIQAVASDNGKW